MTSDSPYTLTLTHACTGDEGGGALQIWRGGVQRGDGLHPALRGEAQSLCLQQDQRWHVHLQPFYPQENRGETNLSAAALNIKGVHVDVLGVSLLLYSTCIHVPLVALTLDFCLACICTWVHTWSMMYM